MVYKDVKQGILSRMIWRHKGDTIINSKQTNEIILGTCKNTITSGEWEQQPDLIIWNIHQIGNATVTKHTEWKIYSQRRLFIS